MQGDEVKALIGFGSREFGAGGFGETSNGDASFAGGAVRSADADHLDFLSLPLIGLIGAARTAAEGAAKYGRFNYLQGMPVHVCLNHIIRHAVLYGAGDRSEPHLSHIAWNAMCAEQSAVMNPEINEAHLPGPGYTITPPMTFHMGETESVLSERRRLDPAWKERLGDWLIHEVPEVARILEQRFMEGDDAEID